MSGVAIQLAITIESKSVLDPTMYGVIELTSYNSFKPTSQQRFLPLFATL